MRKLTILLIAAIWLTFTMSTPAQDDAPPCPADFEGYLSSRLSVGEMARVLFGTELNVRPQPTTTQARIGAIFGGELFTILGGPVCDEGYVWWLGDFENGAGWVAEGSFALEEYWLEPRGEIITVTGSDGIERQVVQVISDNPHANGVLEPVGCLRPPDDYTIVEQDYVQLNLRTLAMLDQAQRIYDEIGGGEVNFRQAITQGSYNAGGVSASFGTHDGGGAVDVSVRNPEDWHVLTDEIAPMIEALRIAGFAAWLRDDGELYPNSPIHIHAIAVGDAELSPAARLQIDGERGYLRGYNGLPEDYAPLPVPDLYGGPVICGWLVEDGFPDLREFPAENE
jgi:hypothetical protein